MPTILVRYMLGELLRVLILTAVVLVAVISLGATIKPLATESLLGPGQTLKFLMLAIVPMFQFALPFAAGFASSMVMFRFVTDNEITAYSAAGLSYRRILTPIAATGVVLTFCMVLLTQSIIPRFYGLMERTIAPNVTRLLQASVRKKTPFQIGNLSIYAEFIDIIDNPPDTDADQRMRLLKVAAAVFDENGSVETDVTAGGATIDVYRIEGRTVLSIVLENTMTFTRDNGTLSSAAIVTPAPITFTGLLEKDLFTMTRTELLDLVDDPDGFVDVVTARKNLAGAIFDERLIHVVDQQLRTTGIVRFRKGENEVFEITADRVRDGRIDTLDQRPVDLVIHDLSHPDDTPQLYQADSIGINRTRSELTEPTFELVIKKYKVIDPETLEAINQREEYAPQGLRLEGVEVESPENDSSHSLLAEARAIGSPSANLQARIRRLEYKYEDVRLEARSRLIRRYALSCTALLLLMVGAIIPLWLRDSQPLTNYLWAFLPSVLDLIMISSGDHMIRQANVVGGLTVMWIGNVLLLVIFSFAYWRVSRN